MSSYRYILEPYKGRGTRHCCPACGSKGAYCLYIDTETGEHLGPEVGRCDRESKCGYHYSPKQYLADNPSYSVPQPVPKRKALSKEPIQASFIPKDMFTQSLKGYEGNNFIKYLLSLFDRSTCEELISRYYIGTSKHWEGATVFWQVDSAYKVKTGKIMLYSPETGKRVKEPYNRITWAHSVLKLPDYNLQQCFFGEHLLSKEPGKPVAIVESEKTAVIASCYWPQFVWLAVGSISNLKAERCKAICGRNIVLFPDLGAFSKWSDVASKLSGVANVTVSGFLESHAEESELAQGLDIADYLIAFTQTHNVVEGQLEERTSVAILSKEFYKYNFEELRKILGPEEALRKVKQYQELSGQYNSCKGFVIHTCPLLTSYLAHKK